MDSFSFTPIITYVQSLSFHPVWTPALIIASPLFLSVLIPTITWTFWLLLASLTALIQSVYVLYTFAIITVDVTCISCLKTVATARRLLLRGWHHLRHDEGSESVSVSGRARWWRKRIKGARTWNGFNKAVSEAEKKYRDNLPINRMSGGEMKRTRRCLASELFEHPVGGTIHCDMTEQREEAVET